MPSEIPTHTPVDVSSEMAEAAAASDVPSSESAFRPTNPDAVTRIAKSESRPIERPQGATD